MSTVFTSETRKPEAESDQFASDEILARQSLSTPPQAPIIAAPQALFGNASIANAEATTETAREAEARQLQSAYGNSVVTRALESRSPAGEAKPQAKPLPQATPPQRQAKPLVAESEPQRAPKGPKVVETEEPVKAPIVKTEAATEKETPAQTVKPASPAEVATEAIEETKPEKVAKKISGSAGKEKKREKEKEGGAKAGKGEGEVAAAGEEAGGPGKKEEGAKPAEVKIARGDPSVMLESLGEVAPSQAMQGLQALRNASGQEFTRQHRDLAENPPTMPRPSGLPRKVQFEEPTDQPAPGEEEEPEEVEAGPGEQTRIDVDTPTITAPLPVPSWIDRDLDTVPEEEGAWEATAWHSLMNVPATDENVDTSAGPRPTVDLTGEARPEQMSEQLTTNRTTFDEKHSQAQEQIAQDFGENDIYPVVPEEILSANIKPKAGRRTKNKSKSPGGIPPDGLAAFDQAAAEQWSAAMADARADDEAIAEERETGESTARASSAKEIARLEAEAITGQTAAQVEAKTGVSESRKGWSDELRTADEAYTRETSTLEKNTKDTIEREKTTAEEDARQKLEAAEIEAAEKKRKAEEEAAKERAKAKKESGGFWGWLKRKAKALINRIRQAINFIFDQLRKAVKYLIDKAKKLAMWAIDKARNAIIGAIRFFGAALEKAADVFLVAFPNTRKKFKKLIRSGVAKAEQVVNDVADALKEKVAAALDALGKALDYVLELYQRAYNAILDAVEFIVIKLIEILEGIARLAESASMVGDYFLGQLQKEGIGVDLTQPLPIEKPNRPVTPDVTAQTAVESGAVPASDAAVLAKPSLNESDVAMSHVAQLYLEPELLASLPPLQEGKDFHFGYNENPENERDAVLQDAMASVGVMPATGRAAEGGNGAAPAAAGGPDVANMTPEQQLAYLENQEIPHTCNAAKEEDPAKSDDVPEHMRIYGPFTPGQRFDYMWGQIKKGISQWWECNKIKVYVGFGIAALITLLLTILTGGAFLAAIPPLLTIIAAFLVGVALFKAASRIGDFITKAWAGDLKGGAEALASALAILTIELVFALLFSLGSVIKLIKSGLKATIKGAATAAKTAVKTSVTAVKELGVATKTAFKAGVANSKLIIQGFRNGFGQGVKTIKDLTRQLLAKSRFRGFFLRLRGRTIELWGIVNPPVKIGEFELTKEDAKKHLEAIAKSGEKMTPTMRAEGEALKTAVEGTVGELSKKLKTRLRKFFRQFDSQHVSKNPVLAEAWNRALRASGKQPRFAKWCDAAGNPKPTFPKAKMVELYTEARSQLNLTIKEVADELVTKFDDGLRDIVDQIPARVQVHHIVYKSYAPELAVMKENLMLALRKTSGSVDEAHDIWHYITAGGGGNRWKVMDARVSDLLKSLYNL